MKCVGKSLVFHLHKQSVMVKGRARTQSYISLAFFAWHRLIRLMYQVDSCLCLIFLVHHTQPARLSVSVSARYTELMDPGVSVRHLYIAICC